MYVQVNKISFGRSAVAERSKASVLRSWMRKVVGSNLGDANIRLLSSFAKSIEKKETAT